MYHLKDEGRNSGVCETAILTLSNSQSQSAVVLFNEAHVPCVKISFAKVMTVNTGELVLVNDTLTQTENNLCPLMIKCLLFYYLWPG